MLAGELSLHEATRELREEGKLPPAKAPEFDRGAGAENPPGPTPPGLAGAAVGLPTESGAALAEALVAAVGADRALELLREAVAAVEAARGRHETNRATAANAGPGGEGPAALPVEGAPAVGTQEAPGPCGEPAHGQDVG